MILVVGNPEFTHTWDTVKVIRPVIIEDDKRAGILQAMINAALRNYLASRQEHLETTLRTIIREELARYDIHDS